MFVTTDDLTRKEVIGSDGRKIGTVIDTEVETMTWTVSSVVVKVNKNVMPVLGLKKHIFGATTIKIKPQMIQGAEDVVRLSMGTAQLKLQISPPPPSLPTKKEGDKAIKK
ncbi:MAG: PRC-barrel domain-containing protein [Thermoplasmata archaeon]